MRGRRGALGVGLCTSPVWPAWWARLWVLMGPERSCEPGPASVFGSLVLSRPGLLLSGFLLNCSDVRRTRVPSLWGVSLWLGVCSHPASLPTAPNLIPEHVTPGCGIPPPGAVVPVVFPTVPGGGDPQKVLEGRSGREGAPVWKALEEVR